MPGSYEGFNSVFVWITSKRGISRTREKSLWYRLEFKILELKVLCGHNPSCCWVTIIHLMWGKHSVTNYYLVGKLSTSLNLSSYLVSSWSKSLSISGGDSSCSWVLVRALGLIVKEESQSVMLGRGWGCRELLVSSSTFAVIQRIRKSVPPQKHPHWKNTNTQL